MNWTHEVIIAVLKSIVLIVGAEEENASADTALIKAFLNKLNIDDVESVMKEQASMPLNEMKKIICNLSNTNKYIVAYHWKHAITRDENIGKKEVVKWLKIAKDCNVEITDIIY
ncbi:MAG: hypothetical protein PHR45_06530 [Muribaculaceae bacterium]|nr:hypothetical protein [Muribaculaceae bacterium]